MSGWRTEVQHTMRRAAMRLVPRRFTRCEKGATAVEFGLIAVPFFAILFAIVDTAMVFFAGQTLETAASESSRLILTGQAQTQGFDQAKFKQAVCANVYALFNCTGGLYVDVKTYSSFANVDNSLPVDGNGALKTGTFGYQPGGPRDIVVVRLMYPWPVTVPLLGNDLSNMGGKQRLLVSTVAFRNEPYK